MKIVVVADDENTLDTVKRSLATSNICPLRLEFCEEYDTDNLYTKCRECIEKHVKFVTIDGQGGMA